MGGGVCCQTFYFPCSADHERDWPPCKVVFFGLATNTLNVRNNNKQQQLKRRESTLAARSEVLEMLGVKDGRWFGRLDDDSAKVKWVRACIHVLITHRHRGRSQAPWTWTVAMLRQPS